MQLIKDIILPRLEGEQTVFVFPSEVAARMLQRQVLDAGGLDASGNNRFISWDLFKEQVVSVNPDKTPVNNYIRTLFTDRLCAENKAAPYFKSLIRPEFAENSGAYLNYLCGLLPVLHRFERLRSRLALLPDKAKLQDLDILLERYRAFLTANRLYEPEYEPAVLHTNQTRYLIFFPEVIKDFAALDPLNGNVEQVACIRTEAIASPTSPELLVFDTTISEVKATLLQIGGLIDRGESPANIVITLAAPDSIASYLKEQARLQQLELDFHQGKDLSSYPGVSFLTQLRQVYRSGFSVRETAVLVRDCALPWKQADLAENLVRFGTAFNCLKNYTDCGKEFDMWQFNFKRLGRSKDYSKGELEAVSGFYLRLKTHITAINTAPDFSELSERVKDFTDAFFTAQFFMEDAPGYYEFALKLLQELIDNSAKVKLPAPESAFTLWLAVLAKKKYVEQNPRQGIAVYPYRVAAGIQPAYHFIINASQANTRYIIREFPFLHVDEEAALNRQDLDLSDALLALYLRSGRHVTISYSRRDFSDSHLPPGFFLFNGSIREYQSVEELLTRDPLHRELDMWKSGGRAGMAGKAALSTATAPGKSPGNEIERAGAGTAPQELLPLQKQGFFRACRTVLAAKTNNYLASPLMDPTLINTLLQRLPHEQGNLRISPTGLELFWGCSFSFLLSQCLDLAPEVYEPQLLDPLWVGTVIHRLFELFFKELKHNNEGYEQGRIEEYTNIIARSLALLEKYFYASEALPLIPVWEYEKQNLIQNFRRFLEVEARTYPGFVVYGLEQTLESDWDKPRLALRGKVDRISVKDGNYIIIDYKKKGTPGARDILAVNDDLSCFQMPFYFYLMDEQNLRVYAASYYSFEKGKYVHVLNPAESRALSGIEEMNRAVEVMKEKIILMAGRLRTGDYSLHPEETPASCNNCMFRGVCRVKYVSG